VSALLDRGFPVALCGPSGSGKTTVIRELLSKRDDLRFSVSVTTRHPRSGERADVHYRFLAREEFEELRAGGGLLEWAEVHGELYGTPRANLERAKAEGRHLLLDIDVQGARQVSAAVPETLTIFLLPPSGVWLERLRSRGSEAADALARRLRTAESELLFAEEFEYVILNDELSRTVRRVEAILEAEESRAGRVGKELRRCVSALQEEIAAVSRSTVGGEMDAGSAAAAADAKKS
jgi:guanylate kinase